MKIILMFGPPGSGKGTQSAIISKRKEIKHISTGEILREYALQKSILGRHLHKILSVGNFVPDIVINKIVKSELSKSSKKGFILDGFPRDTKQAKYLLSILPEDDKRKLVVINLVVNERKSIERIVKRAKLEGRGDDNFKTVLHRIRIYHRKTEDVLSFLNRHNVKIINVNGDDSVKNIAIDIRKRLR